MTQARYTLHVPLQRNDGTAVTDEEFAAIERDLLGIAGGFTSTDGVGGWLSPNGKVYREPVRIYAVDVTATDWAHQRILSLADFVGIALEQEAVYVTRSPIAADAVVPVRVPS